MSSLPEGMSPEAEQNAIAAILGQSQDPVSVEQSVPEPAAVQGSTESEAPAPEVATPETPEAVEESTERTDLAALLEGLGDEEAARVTRAYKSLQGDYTRKTQELAERAKQFEGLDPQAAREAAEFVQLLQTDRNFAQSIHAELSSALQTEGLTPAEASREATRQLDSASTAVDWDELGIDPSNPLARTIEGLQKSNAELTSWREQQIRDNQRDAMIREIERQDQAIRHSNPDYAEGDFDTIYKVAAAMDGDLVAAEQYYRGLKDRILGDYVESKTRVAQGAGPVVPAAQHSEVPRVFESTDQAHPEAVERLRAILAAQGD